MLSSRSLMPITMLAGALACQPAAPAALSDADRTTLRAANDSFVQRVRRADWPGLAKLYTETAVLMPPGEHAVLGQANILAWMKAFPPISLFDLRVVSVDGAGDLAYLTGKYLMTVTPPAVRGRMAKPMADTGKYLEVHRRQPDGSWPMVADIFNSDLAPPKR